VANSANDRPSGRLALSLASLLIVLAIGLLDWLL